MNSFTKDIYGDNPFAPSATTGDKAPALDTSGDEVPGEKPVEPDPPAPPITDDFLVLSEEEAASNVTSTWDFPSAEHQEALDLSEQLEPSDFEVQQEQLPVLSIIPAVHLGPATLAFGLRYVSLYDSNILLSSTGTESDFEHVVSPRILLSLGDGVIRRSNFLAVEYDPQLIFFQHYGQFNTLEEQFRLDGQYATDRITLRESLAYNQSSDPDRELQGRDSRVVVSSETDAIYQVTGRMACELDGTALIRNFQNEIDSDEGRLRFWARYTVTPAWTLALGAAGGGVVPEIGTTQVFQQAWLRSVLQVPDGLTLDLAIGGDFRQMDSTSRLYAEPVIDATIQYAPTTETKLELSAIRQIFASPDVVDQNYTSTRVAARATQRFWKTYKIAVEGGFENASYYEFDGAGVDGNRSDNFPYGRVELAYSRFQDLEFSIFYLFQKNYSSLADLTFSDQQAGIQLRIGF